MAQSIRDVWLPLSRQQIARFEKRMSVRLPDAYREFLLQFNGGKSIECVVFGVDWPNGTAEHDVSYWYSIGMPEAAKHRDLQYAIERNRDFIPPGTIPFARSWKDLLLIDLETEEVCLWVREVELATPPELNRTHVAKRFKAFLRGLHFEPLEERRATTGAEKEPFLSIEAYDFDGFLRWAKSNSLDKERKPTRDRAVLDFACRHANYRVAKWLLEHGVPVDGTAPPGERNTIQIAHDAMCADLVILLLENGAKQEDLRRKRRKVDPYISMFIEQWQRGKLPRR